MSDQYTAIERQLRRLSLRVGIERFLTTHDRYMTQVRTNFHHMSDEDFDGVITEMKGEGLLILTAGRDGGVKITINNGSKKQEATNE